MPRNLLEGTIYTDFSPVIEILERELNPLEALGLFKETKRLRGTLFKLSRKWDYEDDIDGQARGGERNFAGDEEYSSVFGEVPFFPLDGRIDPEDVRDFTLYGQPDTPDSINRKVEDKIKRILRSHEKAKKSAHYRCLVQGRSYAPGAKLLGTKYDYSFADKFGVVADMYAGGGIDFTDETINPTMFIEAKCRSHIIAKAERVATEYKIIALCGEAWFNSLVNHPQTIAAYTNYGSADEPLRKRLGGDKVGKIWVHGGVTYIEDLSGKIPTDEAVVLPLGIEEMFTTHVSPADTIEDNGTEGKDLYIWVVENRRNVLIESENSFAVVNHFPELVCHLTGNAMLPGTI